MPVFSKRNKLKKEYSGYEEASLGLRNRLLLLYGHPYSGNEFHFGVGNTNWIHERAFDKDLQMHFGRKIPIEDFRDEGITSYDEVFDFIELYFEKAKTDLNSQKRLKLLVNIAIAFYNSGSVYKFNKEGQVVLKVNEKTAKSIKEVDNILEPFEKAQKVFRDCVDGLVSRRKAPKDVVKDMFISFEEFSKKATSKKSFDEFIRFARNELKIHSIHIQIIEKLKAYRGAVWGATHASNSPEPGEEDAVWYLEQVLVEIRYLDGRIKQENNNE